MKFRGKRLRKTFCGRTIDFIGIGRGADMIDCSIYIYIPGLILIQPSDKKARIGILCIMVDHRIEVSRLHWRPKLDSDRR